MTQMIREEDMPGSVVSSRGIGFVLGMLLLLAVLLGCMFIAYTAYSSAMPLPFTAWLVLGGASLMSLMGLAGFWASRRRKPIKETDLSTLDRIHQDAFAAVTQPSLIVEDGKPIHANSAYMELCRNFGLEPNESAPPSVDRLFSAAGKRAASAIFRLYHLSPTTDTADEAIDMADDEGVLHRYHLQIKRLRRGEDKFLWQIIDAAEMDYVESALLSEAPVGLFSITESGRILAVNSVLQRWLGGDGARPAHMRDFIESPESLLDSPSEEGRVVRTDTRLITRKGVVTPTIMVGVWQRLNSGDMIANVALYGHSSMHKLAQPPLSANEIQAQVAGVSATLASGTGLAQAPIAMLELIGPTLGEALILSANPAFERMSGNALWQEEKFASVFENIPGEHRFLELSPSQCSADRPYDGVLIGGTSLDGAGLDVSVYIVPQAEAKDRFFAYLVDVSARKSLEAQLVQSQKMQAIGQLAAGVAHDFNNLLTAIRLNTDELLQRHPVGDPSYPELQNINTTGSRAAALVKKLLAFSRKQTRRMERLDVTDTLSDMAITLKQTLGEQAQLKMNHARDLPQIMADKSQIDTVLMNLCVNARDAMAAQGGGNIEIKSELLLRDDIKDPALFEALNALPGDDFVVISVSDNGTGMPEDVQAKIFEPFFTTKEQGKGTGLGLATVYGIVQQSGGYLDVQSELGIGTTFRIFLPAAGPPTEAELAAPVKAEAPVRKPSDMAGQGNILFVEDESSVRVIAAKSLRKRGYNVTEAEDGEMALELLEEAEEPFDIMISDVVMPGMGGPALLKAGRELLGDARIVFISGYAEEEFSELLSEEPDVTFLPKPFTLEQLAEKVKSEIGEAR